MDLSGKVAFITGAARGLGEAYAKALLERGAKVCLCDVNQELGDLTTRKLQSKYGEKNATFVTCDVSEDEPFRDAFSTAVKTFGQIDIMVNNAGIMNESIWEKMIAVNINGVVRGTNIALEHMRKDKGGHGGIIINISSELGFTPMHALPVLTATKHAVIGLTRSWAANPDQDKLGVRFAVLCPRMTDTQMVANFTTDISLDPDFINNIRKGGMAKVETVAEGFIKLLENEDNNGAVFCMKHITGYEYKTFN